MAVTLLCPKLSCRAVLRVPETVRGKKVRCAQCGTAFFVPATSGRSNAPRQPAPAEKKSD